MKNPLILVCITVVFYSCSSTNLISLNVMQPPPVHLSSNIKTAAIVNRVSPDTRDLQVAGTTASLAGLADELITKGRFSSVKAVVEPGLRSNEEGGSPSPLPWDTVERICRDNHTDVLISLELFKTESKISYNASATHLNTFIGYIPTLRQTPHTTTLVKTGWKIYDPSSRNIQDEYIVSEDVVLKQAGNKAGQAFACRMVPHSLRVSRIYYVRGNGNLIIASRLAQAGNWEGAARIWQQETTSACRTVAGRACYNMAIMSEISGDLDGAVRWAQEAYETFNNRQAPDYLSVLRNRQSDDVVLKSQFALSSAR